MIHSKKVELKYGLLAVANCSAFRVPRHLVMMRKRSAVPQEPIHKFVDFIIQNK